MPSFDQNTYSEKTQEIMGKVPSWIVRRGIGVISITFIVILVGCYFIKYPQILTAPVVITTVNPPSDLVARYDGRISGLFVSDGDYVRSGDMVAILESTSDYDAVRMVEDTLSGTMGCKFEDVVQSCWLEKEYRMGDLQASYTQFQSLALEYRSYLSIDHIGKKKELLERQVAKNIEYCSLLKRQKDLSSEDMKYARKGYGRDSMLFANKAISSADIEKSERTLIQQESATIGTEAGIATVELQIMQIRQQLIELDIQRENEVSEYERTLSRYRQELLASIGKWREQYVLESPIDGRITFISYWSSNQRIKTGERLASIIPEDSTRIIGRLSVPSSGFGKVKCGQTVNVKLNGYPYMEFGVLKGMIDVISAVPDEENNYQAEVSFPSGLMSTYKKQLPLIQQMDGTGEIITDDMRLIEQFVRPIRALFDK